MRLNVELVDPIMLSVAAVVVTSTKDVQNDGLLFIRREYVPRPQRRRLCSP